MGVIWSLWSFSTSVTILLLISAASNTKSEDSDPNHCDSCIRVNTTCYQLNYLFNLSGNFRNNIVIHSLGLLRKDNKLFYSYEPEISDPEYVKVGFVSLSNGSNTGSGVLTSETQKFNFGVFDFDQDSGVMYLGGSLGVYQLDTKVNKMTPYSSRFDTIVALFYRNGIYFVQEGEGKIVSKQNNIFLPLLETNTSVKTFVITKDGSIVYVCSAGLMAARNKEIVELSNNPFFRGLSMDLDGHVYAWWVDGIYEVVLAKVLKESRVVKIAHISTIGSMTFDNGNSILFTSGNALYRLSPTNFPKC